MLHNTSLIVPHSREKEHGPVYPSCTGCGRVRVAPPETQCSTCQGMQQDPITKLWHKPSVPDVFRRHQSQPEPLLSQALSLSAGTLSTCTGLKSYADLDATRDQFVRWCDAHPVYTTWQDAWQIFWAAHLPDTCPWPYVIPETGQPSVPVVTLETLHTRIEDAGKQEATRRQTERMTKELCSKKQSPKAQHAPGGLFAKEQLKLF